VNLGGFLTAASFGVRQGGKDARALTTLGQTARRSTPGKTVQLAQVKPLPGCERLIGFAVVRHAVDYENMPASDYEHLLRWTLASGPSSILIPKAPGGLLVGRIERRAVSTQAPLNGVFTIRATTVQLMNRTYRFEEDKAKRFDKSRTRR
jgi:hypothetical protein